MKFKDYVNEDELDILQGKMGAMNKKLQMFKKKIESQTKFKVTEVYDGELESDPGFELTDGYSIQIASPNMWILSKEVDGGNAFQELVSGSPMKVIARLKKE